MNEIQFSPVDSSTLDAVIFNPSLTMVWNTITLAFESLSTATWSNYVIPLANGFATAPATLPVSLLPYPIGIYTRLDPTTPAPTDLRIGITDLRWPLTPETVTQSSYSTPLEADSYFAQLVHTDLWLQTLVPQKQQALNQATALIDQFAYIGVKTDKLQNHEWPRKHILIATCQRLPCDVIPFEILAAQFEIAKAFNDGFDLEREMRGLRVISRGYSSVRTTYDPKSIPLWLEYGIPSFRAWTYLLAYLDRDSDGRIKIHRVS